MDLSNLSEGTKVTFKPNTFFVVQRDSIDISNMTDVVTYANDTICIRLDERVEALDEWNNELIYQDEEDLEDLLNSVSL